MTIERQLGDYGKHLQRLIAGLDVPMPAARVVRPMTAPVPPRRWRWPIAATAAAALVAVGLAALLLNTGGSEPTPIAEEVSPTIVAGADLSDTPLAVVDGGDAVLEPAPVAFPGEPVLSRSGTTLWAWHRDGRIAGYLDGTWQMLPEAPGYVLDVAGELDSAVWMLSASGLSPGEPEGIVTMLPGDIEKSLWYLEGEAWRQLPADDVPPSVLEDAEMIAVDGTTGVLWVASSGGLYSWDGVRLAQTAGPPDGFVLDDIAVAGDGAVWASRSNFLFPDLPAGLVRYGLDTAAWEWVRPLGGAENVPAALQQSPSGTLWAVVAGYGALAEPALAHFDSATQFWDVYEVPFGMVGPLAVDERSVWLGDGLARAVAQFDRPTETWTRFTVPSAVDILGIGIDGTVWVGNSNGLHRLLLDGGASYDPTNILSIREAGPVPEAAVCPPDSTPDVPGNPEQARPPAALFEGASAFDRQSGVLIHLTARADEGIRTWVFDPCANSWTQMEPGDEPPGEMGYLGYDQDSDRVIAVGDGLWAYDFEMDTWERKSLALSAGPVSYHPGSGLVVVSEFLGESRDRAYDVDTDTWYDLGPGAPGGLHARLMAHDPVEGDTYVYTLDGCGGDTCEHDRTWVRGEGGGWVNLGIPTPAVPVGYFAIGTEVAFDESTRTMLIFSGGVAIGFDPVVGGWEVLFEIPWAGEEGTDASPLHRLGHSLVYDPLNERILMLGGSAPIDEEPGWEDPDDVWAFDVRTREWIELLPGSG